MFVAATVVNLIFGAKHADNFIFGSENEANFMFCDETGASFMFGPDSVLVRSSFSCYCLLIMAII